MKKDYATQLEEWKIRSRKIYAEYVSGVHPLKIALKYKISYPRVYQIINREKYATFQ